MAPAAVAAYAAVASAAVSVYSAYEQDKAQDSAKSARRRAQLRLEEAERQRVHALQESEYAVRERRRERRGSGFGTTIAAGMSVSTLGGNSLLGG